MCGWGNTISLNVLVPAHLSHTGVARWTEKPIDACIAPIVQALNACGIHTTSSCCGHGERDGEIVLQDGRTLIVRRNDDVSAQQVVDTKANRDRLAAENARLRAANKRLTYLLGHVLKNGRLEDDEMADARAALADSAPAEQEA